MPSQQRILRERQRNQRAYEHARARKAADPWEQARARCRELNLPGSCVRFVDAIAEHHQEVGKKLKNEPAIIGYGDGTPAEKAARRPNAGAHRPRQPARYASITERTGMSRRSAMRARKLLEGHDVLHCRRAGELVDRSYPVGWRRGDGDRWAAGEVRVHQVGTGGVDPGGGGRANKYWPPGVEPPPPEIPRRRPPTPHGRPAPRSMAELLERARQQRTMRHEARGP